MLKDTTAVYQLNATRFYAVEPDVLVQHVGAKTLLVNLRSNRILELSPTASAAWKLVQEGLSAGDVLTRLCASYDGSPALISDEIAKTLNRFVEEGLIRVRVG